MEQSGNQVTNLIYEALPESQTVRAAIDNSPLTEKQQLDARSEFVLRKYRDTLYLSEPNLKKYIQCRYFPTLYGTVTLAFVHQARQDNKALLAVTNNPQSTAPMILVEQGGAILKDTSKCSMQNDGSAASMSGTSLTSSVISEGEEQFVNHAIHRDNSESNTLHDGDSESHSHHEEAGGDLAEMGASEDVAAVTSALSNRVISTSRHSNNNKRRSKSRKGMVVAGSRNGIHKEPAGCTETITNANITRMRRPKSSNCILTDAATGREKNNDLKNSQHRCSSSGDLNMTGSHGRRNSRMSVLASRRASVRDLGKAGSTIHQRKSTRNLLTQGEEEPKTQMSGFAKRAASSNKRRLRKSASMPVPDFEGEDIDDKQEAALDSTTPTPRGSRLRQSRSTDGHRNLISGEPRSRRRQRGASRDAPEGERGTPDSPNANIAIERQKSRRHLVSDREVERKSPRKVKPSSPRRTRKLDESKEVHSESTDDVSIGDSSDEDEDHSTGPCMSGIMDDDGMAAKIKSMVRNVGSPSEDESAATSLSNILPVSFGKYKSKEAGCPPQTEQKRASGMVGSPMKRRSSTPSVMNETDSSDDESEQKTSVTKIRAASTFLALAAEKRRIVQSAKAEKCTTGASLL